MNKHQMPVGIQDCHNCGQTAVCTWDGSDWLCQDCDHPLAAGQCAEHGGRDLAACDHATEA